MSDSEDIGPADPVLTRLHSCVDDLFGLSLDSWTDEQILELWRGLETATRRLSCFDQHMIAQVQSSHRDFVNRAPSITVLTRQVLHIGIREAKARVSAAEAAGPRRALTGEALPPIYESVAAAQAAGAISAAHARQIVTTIDALPDAVQASEGVAAEALLVEQAKTFDPDALALIAHRLTDTLDPDGRFSDIEHRQRRRELRLRGRGDGSAHLEGELTAEAHEHLKTVLDALSGPKPAVDGARDPRTPGQRCHDALLDVVKLAERAEQLPNAGGVTTTLILTADAQDWTTGTGTVRTGHGVLIPTGEAKRWVSGDTRVIGVTLDQFDAVQAYTDCRRIFSENQRLAMVARDKGCAFVGCDAPPQHCEAHHVIAYADGGPTTVSNGCLLCRWHHREHQRMGWHAVMIDNQPHWTPPPTVDPHGKPIRNTTHDPAAGLHPI